MAKLGRYSAQIKKVQAVSAAKDIEVAEGGTIFVINGGGYNITLPKLSEIPAGWWCEFGTGTTGSVNLHVLVDDDNAGSMIGTITGISASAEFTPGVSNTAYFLNASTCSFNYADFTSLIDGVSTQVECTKVSDSNWRLAATCFKPGFVTGSA